MIAVSSNREAVAISSRVKLTINEEVDHVNSLNDEDIAS